MKIKYFFYFLVILSIPFLIFINIEKVILPFNKILNLGENFKILERDLDEKFNTLEKERTKKIPSSSSGLNYYAQGGVIVDNVAYFTADHSNPNDNYDKSKYFPYVVSFEATPPFKKIRTYAFEDTYDSSPIVLKTKHNKTLVIAHEYKRKRTKAINAKTGNTEWVSEDNQPGANFFGYSYFDTGDGKILYGAYRNGIHAMSLVDGKEIWAIKRKSIGGATPAVDQEKGFVYYQYNGGVIKINALDGSIIKEIKVEKPNNVISWNTVLVKDKNLYRVATYWHEFKEYDSAIRVYDSNLNLKWEKLGLPSSKKGTLTYANGILTTGVGNYWLENYFGDKWKVIKAWSVLDGSLKWTADLKNYGFRSIMNIPYFNGYFYAETQDTHGFISKIFKINSENGNVEEVLDHGKSINSCAPAIIANGYMFSGDLHSDKIIVTKLEDNVISNWKGPFGNPQTNTNSVEGLFIKSNKKMKVINPKQIQKVVQ